MDFLKHYLKEDEEIEEPEDSIQEPEEDYGLDFIDDENFDAPNIDVEEIPDNSDATLDADEFLYGNSQLISYYSKGNGFKLNDNQDYYEVIKMVKDMTDKHFYHRDMVWKVDVAHNKAVFQFKLGKSENLEQNNFFLSGIQQYILTGLLKKFGDSYKIDTEFSKSLDGQDVMTVKVEKDKKQKELKQISTRTSDSASFITKSSVSRM